MIIINLIILVVCVFMCVGGGGSECCEDDDKVVDLALEAHVFHFLSTSVVAVQGFHSEEFYLRRLHGIISDFIYQMPLKVSWSV